MLTDQASHSDQVSRTCKRAIAGLGILCPMVTALFSFRYVVAALSLWLNRQQQDVFDIQKVENRFLKAKFAGDRISFGDPERRRLAWLAKVLGCNLSDVNEGWFSTPRKLITDRDTKYCLAEPLDRTDFSE